MLEPLDIGQAVLIDFIEAAKVAGEGSCFLIDSVATQVFEQIVVRVHAVQGRVSRMRFVQVPEQIVDESEEAVRKRACVLDLT